MLLLEPLLGGCLPSKALPGLSFAIADKLSQHRLCFLAGCGCPGQEFSKARSLGGHEAALPATSEPSRAGCS